MKMTWALITTHCYAARCFEQIFFLALLFALAPLTVAHAGSVLSCDGPNVRVVNQPGKPPLKYFFLSGKSGKGTVIYAEGGPEAITYGLGGEEWTEAYIRMALKVSPDVNLVLFDYRGLGCNQIHVSDFTSAPQNFTSTGWADDVTAIVKHAGLKNKEFIVKGSSFGTVVVAKYANRVKASDPQPLLVMLESSVARAAQDQELNDCDQDCWAVTMYERHLKKLSKDAYAFFQPTVEQFKGWSFPSYLGYDGKTWSSFISRMVTYEGYGLNPVLEMLYKLVALKDETVREQEQFKKMIKYLDRKRDANSSSEPIGALDPESQKEKSPAPDANPILDSGGLRGWISDGDLNHGGSEMKNYFEPPFKTIPYPEARFVGKRLSSQVPILFVHGSFDPLTLFDYAYEHFRLKKAPEKYFAEVVEDSHKLQGFTCSANFLDALFRAGSVRPALPELQSCAALLK